MNFQRYLSAKRTVDDRALNRRVEDRLAEEIEGRDRLRVLDVGAGVGASVERLLARPWLPDRVTYTALDIDPENVAVARERLPPRAAAMDYAVRRAGARDDRSDRSDRDDRSDRGRQADQSGRFVLTRGPRRVEVAFRVADAFEFLAQTDQRWDLLVAHAFVDLVDPADALSAFRSALAPDGLAYCPITFDGGTAFEPTADREFEDRLLDRFHQHIDRSGDSRAGRHLLARASESRNGSGNGDAEGRGVLAAGGSDWVVHPRGGEYPADEAYFLRCIVEMVERAVRKEGMDGSGIEDDRLSEWVARRRDQIESAELVYCAHQLDLLVR